MAFFGLGINQMQYIDVPFKDKDQAKQIGARWDGAKKSWYIPDGVPIASFERWLPKHAGSDQLKARPTASINKSKIASKSIGVETAWPISVGKDFFQIDHDCIPWEDCGICAKDERIVRI
jgi:hypothetical protein